MWIRFPLFLFLVLILFSGCNSVKKEDLAEIASTPDLNLSLEAAFETSDYEKGEWPDDQWWKLFKDDQLDEMMGIALKNNPTLKSAQMRVESAYQKANSIKARLFPHLDTGFETNFQHLSQDSLFRFPPSKVPAVINQIDFDIGFSYEFDFWGRNRNAYEAAIGTTKSQLAEKAQSDLIISTALTKSYFDYQMHLKKLELTERLLAQRETLFVLTKLRLINGLDNEIAVQKAKANVFETQENVTVLEEMIKLDEHLMKTLMGYGPDKEYAMHTPIARFDRSFPLPENLPLDLLARRPDLMAQIWVVEAAAHEIKVAKAAFYPNINLAAFIGIESLDWNKFLSKEAFKASLNPAIHLPIFTGGKLTANLKESVAEFNVAIYDYNQGLLNAAKEVTDYMVSLSSLNQQDELQLNKVESIRKSFQLEKMRYNHGLINALIVLEAEEALMMEDLRLMTLQNSRLTTVLNLIKSLGGGYEAPVPEGIEDGS